MKISDIPTEEEIAATLSALTLLISSNGELETSKPGVSWKFSGRWWARPSPVTRLRPFKGARN